MAKSMKDPVLVFEKIEETEVLLEGLELVTTNANWRKRKIEEQFKEEITTNTLRVLLNDTPVETIDISNLNIGTSYASN